MLGSSAGGFGTALVGNDILESFPDCDDCTCIVDGAAIDIDLKECAETLWQVPESISAALHTADPVADGLEYLYAHQKGRVKIGYVISLRDYVLMRYQNFIDTKKEMGWPPEAGERMVRSNPTGRLPTAASGFRNSCALSAKAAPDCSGSKT